jgi:hypothetical protein
MIRIFIVLAASLISSPTQEAASCRLVKTAIAIYGEAAVEAWARSKGISEKEIERARRCLR